MKIKKRNKYNAKKTEKFGVLFDSETESRFYQHLLKNERVEYIELQPEYKIIQDYTVSCKRCKGSGKRPSPKTGKPINCTLCSGRGERNKAGARYTADFLVKYDDGCVEVIDVKGYKAERDFSLRKKLFEKMTGKELIVVRWKNKQWVRD